MEIKLGDRAGLEGLKESAIAVIRTQAKDAVAEAEAMPPEQWARYSEMLKSYYSGCHASDGWQFAIESAMQNVGCGERLAFVLAAIRQEQPLRDAVKQWVK